MKNVKYIVLSALCFLALLFTLSINHQRLDRAATAPEVQEVADEAGQESNAEAALRSNGDSDIPTHAVTVASEDELANLSPRAESLLAKAEAYMKANSARFTNQNYVTAVDFTLPSSQARMYVEDLRTGVILSYHVAHGSGSDPANTGTPTRFSNVEGSQASSVGFFRVSETYMGKHGLSARLDGLSTTNSNVRARAVVVHGANYVFTTDKKAGRSWGCLAVNQGQSVDIVNMLKGGSVLYAEGK